MTEQSTSRRRLGLAAKWLGSVVLITGLTGVIYEQVGERRDHERLPQIGRSVDIGGRSLNIFCSGEGSPAVILESGAGDPGYAWSEIQPEIAKFTEACWFDRAGEGWSDPGPFPRTSAAMSAELHQLLHRAGVPPPYVLVGHSLGGLNARVYNGMYPDDVAGAVLVDAAHEDDPKRAPAFMLGHTAPRYLWRAIWILGQTARRLGIVRLLTPREPLPTDPAQRTREQVVRALRQQPKAIAGLFDATLPESYAQAAAAGGFGDRPLIVLTAGRVDIRRIRQKRIGSSWPTGRCGCTRFSRNWRGCPRTGGRSSLHRAVTRSPETRLRPSSPPPTISCLIGVSAAVSRGAVSAPWSGLRSQPL